MDAIDFGENKYCGPSVVSALTGLNTDESAALFSKVTGRKVITSVTYDEEEKVLNLCGIESRESHCWSGSSVYRFIIDKIYDPGKYLVHLDKHVVLVEITADKKANILDNHTVSELNISSSSRLTEKVLHCRKVYDSKRKTVESLREEFASIFDKKKAVPKIIKSFIIKKKCPTCLADAVEVKRSQFYNETLIFLKCGHVVSETNLKIGDSNYNFKAENGDTLMPFQVEGVKFAEQSNVRCLIGDEQGLGKTVQGLSVVRLHKDELFPIIGVVKTTLTHQWFHQFRNWVGKKLLIQILRSGKDVALPGFDVYLISYDLLDAKDFFDDVDFKTVIFDECQMVKNHLAKRSKASQKLAAKAEHIIALSGTAIKNNAGEYFTILNILQPGRFPEFNRYIREHCDVSNNKVGGLKNPARFHELTSDFIIRRTKEEVFPDLPATQRNFHHVELDPRFNKAYAEALEELDDLMYSDKSGEQQSMHILAIMTRMRRIAGLSKTLECADFVADFLDSCERPILIFAHHHDVVDVLLDKINKELSDRGLSPALNLTAQVKDFARAELVNNFIAGKSRVMIASTLSSGEGLDGLQRVCSDMVILERQWNPANEEQVEGRIDRRIGQSRKANITYMIATDTIDEDFTELVEVKRSVVASTLDNKEIAWDQSSLLKELASIMTTRGRKTKWKLPVRKEVKK